MYKTSSYTQFNQAGFGPGDSLIAKEDAWSEPALPKFKHCWPTFSSRNKFYDYVKIQINNRDP